MIRLNKQFIEVTKDSFRTALIMSLAHLILIFSDIRKRQILSENLFFTLDIAVTVFLTLLVTGSIFICFDRSKKYRKKYKITSFLVEIILIILFYYLISLLIQDGKPFIY